MCICLWLGRWCIVSLIDIIETRNETHSRDYLSKLVVDAVNKCKKFGCGVRRVVSDNAANVIKMRQELAKAKLNGHSNTYL